MDPPPPNRGNVAAGPYRLRYRIEGTGTTALVIGSAIYYPRVFSQNLRKRLRLVFLDHRGLAPPPGTVVPRSEQTLEVILDDTERARQQLGLGKVVVIGHSGHALMALEYAKRYPANVSHVVMVGIAPRLDAAGAAAAEASFQRLGTPERKAALAQSLRRTPDTRLAALPPRERFVAGYVREGPRTWYDPHFDGAPLWKDVPINVDVMQHIWDEEFRDIDITRGLASFDRPVFLALGRYDFVVGPPSTWDSLRPQFKDLTVRVFERSGHVPPLEEPVPFDTALLRWLATHHSGS
jgi:proline iminopeptidase